MALEGGCQCGAVRFRHEGEPLALYICHCHECRKQSASAFGMSLEVCADGFRILGGTPRFWSRRADSGNTVRCAFCDTCGSRLWHERDGAGGTLTIKVGALDAPVDAGMATHIWTVHKLPGIVIPEAARRFEREPV